MPPDEVLLYCHARIVLGIEGGAISVCVYVAWDVVVDFGADDGLLMLECFFGSKWDYIDRLDI